MPSDKKLIRSEDFISDTTACHWQDDIVAKMIDRARDVDENLVVEHMEIISYYELLTTNWLNDWLTNWPG